MSEARRSPFSRDPLIFGAVCAVALALIGFLWLIARDADSAGVSGRIEDVDPPQYSAAEVCTNWATYWATDSGVDIPPEILERISNCRQTPVGDWIVPANAADERIVRPVVLTAAERASVSDLENAITSQVSRFTATMSTELQDGIGGIYDPKTHGVTGHLQDGPQIGPTRRIYVDEMTPFLEQANNQDLAAYVAWAVEYRKAAFFEFMDICTVDDLYYLRLTCASTGDTLSVNYIPWSWDLSNPLLLDTYLRGVLDGTIPAPPGYDVAGPVRPDSSAS